MNRTGLPAVAPLLALAGLAIVAAAALMLRATPAPIAPEPWASVPLPTATPAQPMVASPPAEMAPQASERLRGPVQTPDPVAPAPTPAPQVSPPASVAMDVQPATETLPDTEVAVVELPPPPQKWRVASTVTIGNSAFVQRSQYVAKWATSSEVHVIGVYDGGSSGKHSNISGVFIPGTTQVNVRGMSRMPVSLVLSSYEQTHWVLKGSGVKSLESILVTGYGLSDVTGIDTSKVINRSGPDNRLTSSGHAWTDNGPDDSTASLVAGVESVFGTRIASFTGIYSTSPKLGTVTSVAHPADLQVNVLVR